MGIISRNSLRVCVLLVGMSVLLVGSAWYKSPTYDEKAHWAYGRRMLTLDTRRTDMMDDSKMPFSVLNALPWRALEKFGLQDLFLPDYRELPQEEREAAVKAKSVLLAVKAGRLATMLFTVLSGLVIFFWARALYGPPAALLSLVLFVLSPNILAHGRLVTTDIYGMGGIAIACYAFWRYHSRPSYGRCALAGLALGFAQLAKFTSLYLVVIDGLLLLPFISQLIRSTRDRGLRAVWTGFAHLLLFVGVALFILNAGFFFQGSLRSFGSYSFESALFKRVQSKAGVLAEVPLPLPAAFVRGLDMVKSHEQSGASFGKIYLLGRLKDLSRGQGGFPGYYFVAMLYKFPLPLFVFACWSLTLIIRHPSGKIAFWEREWFLLCPVVCFAIILNFLNNAQIGIRHFLVVSPFVLVLCGRVLSLKEQQKAGKNRMRAALIGFLICWQAISVCSYYPHFISYFNELAWDRKNNWRLLADSNLEWGQNERYLERFIRLHPEAKLNPEKPCCGLVVVDTNILTGVLAPESAYAWLRERYQPVGHVAYGYAVYDIPQSDCAGSEYD